MLRPALYRSAAAIALAMAQLAPLIARRRAIGNALERLTALLGDG